MPVSLRDDTVPLQMLALDPNNPRFADLSDAGEVAEERVAEESVQARALQRMTADEFEIDQLKESIRTSGYKTVNSIVVSELPDPGHFRVIEGNRRVAALIMLKSEADSGHGDPLTPDLVGLVEAVPVKILEGGTAGERADFIEELLGTLHVPGTKAWGPFQQSQRVGHLLDRGWSATAIRSRLGISTPRFTSLRRAYVGMNQMKADVVFGALLKPKHFSHFEESLSRPRVREWLAWDEDDGITDAEARERFYGWLTSVDNAGNAVPVKIIDAKDFRLLPPVLNDAAQRERFFSDPNLNLQEAAEGVVPPPREINWRQLIASELDALRAIPAVSLQTATGEDIASLQELARVCGTLLRTIEFARQAGDANTE